MSALFPHPAGALLPGAPPLPTRAEIDAVVLDIGGVFTLRGPSIITEALAACGIAADGADEAHHRAHYWGVRGLTDAIEEQHLDEGSADVWRNYEVAHLLQLGVEAHQMDDAVAVLGRLYVTQTFVWRRVIKENVTALARLAAAGIPLAIVSNNNGTAAQQLIDLEVAQVGPGPLPSVAIIVDSGIEGIAKPNPAIFLPALRSLGTDPARSLYVGDTVHADVMGARGAGMPVVQLDPYDLHADHDHLRAIDLVAIANALGA